MGRGMTFACLCSLLFNLITFARSEMFTDFTQEVHFDNQWARQTMTLDECTQNTKCFT